MDYWNDKDCPMWMIHLMVCLEWLSNNAFTLTTNYLCYIVSHCWPLWYAKLMFIVQTLLVSRKALLENKRQYSCSYSYPLLTIMIIDVKLLCFIVAHDLTWNGLDMFPNYDQNVCLFELVYGPFCLHFTGDFVW